MNTRIRAKIFIPITMLIVSVLSAGGPRTAVASDDDFSCDSSGSPEATSRHAISLAGDAHSFVRMGCASDLLSEASQKQDDDLGLQIEAARVLTKTLDFLHILQADDLMGVNQAVAEAIVKHSAQFERVAERAYEIAPKDARAILYRALAARGVDGSVDLVGLSNAIEVDPNAEGGLAQIVSGRSYYELPTFLGGNGQRAIELLEQARKIDPSNPRALRYLAEAYDQEGRSDEALRSLRELETLVVSAGEEQRLSDELRHAIALSTRLGGDSRAAALQSRRQIVLSRNPELLTRASHAAAGHGGPNPLTGK